MQNYQSPPPIKDRVGLFNVCPPKRQYFEAEPQRFNAARYSHKLVFRFICLILKFLDFVHVNIICPHGSVVANLPAQRWLKNV